MDLHNATQLTKQNNINKHTLKKDRAKLVQCLLKLIQQMIWKSREANQSERGLLIQPVIMEDTQHLSLPNKNQEPLIQGLFKRKK